MYQLVGQMEPLRIVVANEARRPSFTFTRFGVRILVIHPFHPPLLCDGLEPALLHTIFPPLCLWLLPQSLGHPSRYCLSPVYFELAESHGKPLYRVSLYFITPPGVSRAIAALVERKPGNLLSGISPSVDGAKA
jgi:hypothetical protein